MINILAEFFRMGGYGFYVWLAYGSVIIFLALQLFIPWQRWRHYFRHQQSIRHKE